MENNQPEFDFFKVKDKKQKGKTNLFDMIFLKGIIILFSICFTMLIAGVVVKMADYIYNNISSNKIENLKYVTMTKSQYVALIEKLSTDKIKYEKSVKIISDALIKAEEQDERHTVNAKKGIEDLKDSLKSYNIGLSELLKKLSVYDTELNNSQTLTMEISRSDAKLLELDNGVDKIMVNAITYYLNLPDSGNIKYNKDHHIVEKINTIWDKSRDWNIYSNILKELS
jgi:hypothetical protein